MPLFDFGFKVVRPVPQYYRVAAAMWSWTIIFRDKPNVIYHIVRRTGNLKRWD